MERRYKGGGYEKNENMRQRNSKIIEGYEKGEK